MFADGVPSSGADLTDPSLWVAMAETEDPFADHRPGEIVCPVQSWGTEGLAFEIDTGLCNYLSAQQPLLVPLSPGDEVELTVGHFPLVALEEAEAHAALSIDGDIVWEIEVPIPSETRVYEATWLPPRTIEAGAAVVFHLHNHGANDWFLARLERRSPR